MTTSLQFVRCEWLIVLVVMLGITPAWSAELLELVSDDVAVCWHFPKAKERTQHLERSEFAGRLVRSTFFSTWRGSNDYRKLEEVNATLSSLSGKPLRTTLEELFGQDVLVAVRLHPTTFQPSVIIALQAESSAAVQDAVKLWNQLDQWTSTSLQYRGRDYVQLKKTARNESLFYVVFDRTMVVTHDEELLRRSIELQADGRAGSLAALPAIQAAVARATPQDVLRVHLNPRACDGVLSRERNQWPPLAKAVWTRTRWVSARAALNVSESGTEALQVAATLDYDGQDTPTWWQRLMASDAANVTSDASTVPASALIAVSGRVRTESLQDLLKAAQSDRPMPKDLERSRRIARGLLLGLDPVDDVLPQLGKQWSAAIVPRIDKDSAFPVDALFVLELNPRPTSNKQPLPLALDNGLNAALNMVAAMQNSKDPREPAIVQQKIVDGVTLRSIAPLGAFSPSAAVTKDFVVLSSSAELCEHYLQELKKRSTESSIARTGSQQSQRCVANVRAMRTLLDQRRDWFIKQAARDQVAEAEALRRLKDADEFLGLLDGADISLSGDAHKLEVTLGISAGKE